MYLVYRAVNQREKRLHSTERMLPLCFLLYTSLLSSSLSSFVSTDSLTCKCESCPADFCVVDPKGACAALAYRNTSDSTQTIIQRKCFNSSELKVFCNASNSKVVVQCCSSHFCNTDLSPKPPPAGEPSPPGTVVAPGPPRPTLILVPTNQPSRRKETERKLCTHDNTIYS